MQPMIKKSASKAFIICGGLILLAMIASTIYAAISSGLEGKDIFAAPLLGFYTGIYYFIFVYPAVFFGFVIYAYFKN
ncbi:MAG: hypothetical protein JKY66_00225 [Spongiibacteraceae bacterium]|nr:hypothetical protein [Spongiibacteraceae bacterium]MBN4055194.1 hypothetical protein [bacterium AH-315-K03]